MDEVLLLRQENANLKAQIAELKKLIFGARSERHIPTTQPAGQADLFGFTTDDAQAPEPEKVMVERKKPQPKKQAVRQPIPAHLPRKTTVIEPDNIDVNNAIKIGEDVTEFLNYKPSQIYVERIVRPKYRVEETIVIAPLKNAQPIAKSNAGAALIAHILISKYIDHIPLYRLRKMLKREGVIIPESTINGWVQMGMKLLESLAEHIEGKIAKLDYLMADETPIPVLESMKPGSTHKGYYWVYYSPPEKLVHFRYHKSRAGEAVKEHLKGFKGYLQTDGYAGYNQFNNTPGITLLACMAHARRKFFAALDNDKELASQALEMIGRLYDIECHAREQQMEPAMRHTLRQKQALPILAEMEAWLNTHQARVLPKSTIGQAISYTLSLWSRLKKYTEDGRLEIDNNLIENKIRPIALGRKNYLFAGSHEAANRAGIIYSFMAMCQMEEVNPHHWLTDILQNINSHSIQRLDQLLPANWKKENLTHLTN